MQLLTSSRHGCRVGGGEVRPVACYILRNLGGVVHVPWRMLRDFQHRARMDLPTDLRRLLLEVGDVGKALFFAPFLRVHNATEGLQPWVWTERVEFVDVDG